MPLYREYYTYIENFVIIRYSLLYRDRRPLSRKLQGDTDMPVKLRARGQQNDIVASFSRLPFEPVSSEVMPPSNLRRTPLCGGSRQKPN